jgi:DNA-binding NarL/FixJ family response regulator
MALTSAERQRRYRERLRAKLHIVDAGGVLTLAQQDAMVELAQAIAEIAEMPIPEDHRPALEAAVLKAAQAWRELEDVSALGNYAPDDVRRIHTLAADLEKKVEARRILSPDEFTPRERALLSHLMAGKPNKLIARELEICEGTVKIHIRRLMRKLRVENRTQAALAIRDRCLDSARQ